jgi:hypothetical protein
MAMKKSTQYLCCKGEFVFIGIFIDDAPFCAEDKKRSPQNLQKRVLK